MLSNKRSLKIVSLLSAFVFFLFVVVSLLSWNAPKPKYSSGLFSRCGKPKDTELEEVFKLDDAWMSDVTSKLGLQESLLYNLMPTFGYTVDGGPALVKPPACQVPQFTQFTGTSMFVGLEDREERLNITMRTWLKIRGLDEIVLVDWSSKKAVRDVINENKLWNSRIRIMLVEVHDQKDYIPSIVDNLGAYFTTRDKIIKSDVDYAYTEDFLEAHVLTPGASFKGDMRIAPNIHLNGFWYGYRADFVAIGGYDERMRGYGYEDQDIQDRIGRLGREQRDLNYTTIQHLDHPGVVDNTHAYHGMDSADDVQKIGLWSPNYRRTSYDGKLMAQNYCRLKARQLASPFQYPPA